MSVWTFTETVPDYAEPVRDLWSWGLNYGWGDKGNPWPLFLDLIGYSAERFGTTLAVGADSHLGYTEASLLADAMTAWADRPHEVEAWLTDLIDAESDPD